MSKDRKKTTFNALLNHKAHNYKPMQIEVEKVIPLYGKRFEQMRDHPLEDAPEIIDNKDLMYMEGNTAHCILFLDANGSDGILVEAEGADYARKSQFISNARAIIEANDITAGEHQLHAELKAMADRIAELAHTGQKHFIFEDMLGDEDLRVLMIRAVAEMLDRREDLAEVRDHYLGIAGQADFTVTAKPTQEMKLYCPLEIQAEPQIYETDWDAPYEKQDHRLVIDETAAKIVRYIFKLRLEGKSCCRIAAILNEQQIVPPRDYYYQKRNKPNPRNVHHRWTDGSVSQMLKNEVYIGNTVQYKTEAPSYKCRNQMPQKPEQWIRCDNTHEPIISREDWDVVQSLWKQTTARKKPVYNPLFTGLLRCADCGAHMNFKPDMNRRKDGTNLQHHAYTCGTYKHGGSGACTSHWIMENALMELVRNDLEQYVKELEMNEEQLQNLLMEQYSRDTKSDRTATEKELHSARTRIAELEMLQEKLYEELLLGQLPRETLIEMSQKYRTEKTALEQKSQELQSELDRLTAKAEDIRNWLCVVREYMSGTVLDRELLHRLIKVIRVGETNVVDSQKQREVEIIYRF